MHYEGTGRTGEKSSNCLSEDSVEERLRCVFTCLRLVILEYFSGAEGSIVDSRFVNKSVKEVTVNPLTENKIAVITIKAERVRN